MMTALMASPSGPSWPPTPGLRTPVALGSSLSSSTQMNQKKVRIKLSVFVYNIGNNCIVCCSMMTFSCPSSHSILSKQECSMSGLWCCTAPRSLPTHPKRWTWSAIPSWQWWRGSMSLAPTSTSSGSYIPHHCGTESMTEAELEQGFAECYM